MKWVKHHEIFLFLISLFMIFFSLWPFASGAEKKMVVNLVHKYLDINFVVQEEQKVQSKPEEPHTVEEQKITVFVYHNVRPFFLGETKEQDLYDITPENFEQQLIYLRDNGYHVISPNDLFVDKTTGKVVTDVTKPVMITFDDGWKSQYEYAFPLLKKYNFKALFYIYIDPVGAPAFLSWSQIKEMRDAGMTMGSHTMSHPLLKKLSDSDLHREVFESKRILEKKLGIVIKDFATPYGYSDDRISSVARDAGYRTLRTLFKGSYHDNLLSLKGYLVRDGMNEFISILNSN